jgi:hypothetical protein
VQRDVYGSGGGVHVALVSSQGEVEQLDEYEAKIDMDPDLQPTPRNIFF